MLCEGKEGEAKKAAQPVQRASRHATRIFLNVHRLHEGIFSPLATGFKSLLSFTTRPLQHICAAETCFQIRTLSIAEDSSSSSSFYSHRGQFTESTPQKKKLIENQESRVLVAVQIAVLRVIMSPDFRSWVSDRAPTGCSFLFSVSLLLLLVRVALKLRSLRFHSPRSCRIAVFFFLPLRIPLVASSFFPPPVFGPSFFPLPPPGGLDRLRAFSLPSLVCVGGVGFHVVLIEPN